MSELAATLFTFFGVPGFLAFVFYGMPALISRKPRGDR